MGFPTKHIRDLNKLCIATIDVGYRNFAVGAEEITLPLDSRTDACQQGKLFFFHNQDFGMRKKGDDMAEGKLMLDISDWLEEQDDIWQKCKIVLIEQQLKRNPFAQKIEQHVKSWFLHQYRQTIIVLSFSATHKTKVFKAPRMSKPERKKWAIEKAHNILTQRGDTVGLQIMEENKRKADDLGDVLCMIQAWKILNWKDLISSD